MSFSQIQGVSAHSSFHPITFAITELDDFAHLLGTASLRARIS